MGSFRNSFLWQIEGPLAEIACFLTPVQRCSHPARQVWMPAINAYRCRDAFVICVELAGVKRSRIELQVEPRRLCIRGQRTLPEPEERAGPLLQVLAMEIDHGTFERELVLPVEVEPEEAVAEECHGLLWIRLPLRLVER